MLDQNFILSFTSFPKYYSKYFML